MSRIIVKNIPSHFSQKEMQKHFSTVDTVTDAKIMRNEDGKSRRFGFIGFKNAKSAEKAIAQFNQTFMGVSKITINQATIRNSNQSKQENEKKQKPEDKEKSSKSNQKNGKVQDQNIKKFNQYKKIVKQGVKKSWDDMLIPTNNQVEQQQEKLTKKQKKAKKIEEKQAIQKDNQDKANKKASKNQKMHMKIEMQIKPIKAPELSEKNKKFVQKPLQIDESRLYVTNLPYELTEQQLKKVFAKYGNVTKIKLPRNQNGQTKGFAFVTYSLSEQALRAFSKIDKTIVFGRIIHVKPSLQDIGQIIKTGKQTEHQKMIQEKYGDGTDEKTSYKKQKKKEMRSKLNDTTNWNTIFLNPNTVLQRVSKKLGISKTQILVSQNLAPKVALAQAQVINETKQWMKSVGINLDFMGLDRQLCQRNKKIILVKNLNFRTMQTDLRSLFNYYGVVNRMLLAPNRAIALVEYQNQTYAQNAMQKLQNHKFKNNFLYLEYAPVGILNEQKVQQIAQQEQQQRLNEQQLCKVIYIKNLSFNTTERQLKDLFEKQNGGQNVKSVKIVQRDGKSLGYGFVQFSTAQIAQKSIKKFQNSILGGHKILLSMSQKKKEAQQKAEKMREKLKTEQVTNNKLMIRNVAFQATKQQLKDLFKQFGTVTKIRLPKKMNGQHRGFAFVQFESLQDAGVAKQALTGTHLYGRRLVIEYESQK